MKSHATLVTLAAVLFTAITSQTRAYVYPMFGGAQVEAPMIMPEIYFDGQGMLVLDEDEQPFLTMDWDHVPILRPLDGDDAFDPAQPWAVLTDKAYNFQYGPDSALWDNYTHPFPASCEVWFKVLEQTPGLETYYADSDPAHGYAQYAPLFGTAGSSPLWLWNKGMHHNAYAVPEGVYGRWSATYEVYVGDAVGAKLPTYESTTVTYRWLAPCPWILTGDINSDCTVDFSDMQLMIAQWLNTCDGPDWCDNADLTRTGEVNFIDFAKLAANWLIDCQQAPLNTACIPR